jgi:hypothetical protein
MFYDGDPDRPDTVRPVAWWCDRCGTRHEDGIP